MKLRSLFRLMVVACAVSVPMADVSADPILPYQQPIATQLTNDLNSGGGNANTLNKALNTYHRKSKTLSGDTSILRDLNHLLSSTPNYPELLASSASAYLVDFTIRDSVLTEQLRPAPRSDTKNSAKTQLGKIDTALANALVAGATSNTTQQIKHLQTAATKLPQASNTVQRAVHANVGLSSMSARIGALKFASSKGYISGGTNFQSETASAVGEFLQSDGVLTVSAIDNASIVRGITMHVEGISTNTPATYPLGIGQNSAFYDATDLSNRREYHFQARAELMNSVVPLAYLTIDYIGTNYLLARFAFVATNAAPISNPIICVTNMVNGTNMVTCGPRDTNTIATISEGEFQLNFLH